MSLSWSGYSNKLRVGRDWSASRQPSQSDPSYPVTLKIYQSTDYSFYDYDGKVTWSGTFGSSSHTGRLSNSTALLHATLNKTFTAVYTGTQKFSLTITGTATDAGPVTGSWDGTVPRRPTGAPTAVRNLTAVVNSYSSVTLTWDAPSDMKGTTLDKYEVRTDSGTRVSNGTSRTCTITGLNGSTTYSFTVRAVGDGWDSDRNGADATTSLATPAAVPDTPAAPVVSAITSSSATITMGTPTTPGLPVTDTAAWIYDAASGGTAVWTDSAVDTSTSWTATGLARATALWAEVAACNASGWSAYSPRTAFTTLPDLPGAPSGYSLRDLTANTAYTTGQMLAVNGGEAPTDMEVQWGPTPDAGTADSRRMGAWTDAFLDGMAAGATYSYRLRAYNRAGAGAWSAWQQFTTSSSVPNQVAAPRLDTYEPPLALISWDAAVPNSAEVSGYQFQLSTSPAFSNLFHDSYQDDLDALVSGVQAGVQYYARVRPNSTAGPGAWSQTTKVPGQSVGAGAKVWLHVAGVWKRGTLWTRVGGVWRQAALGIRADGDWRSS